MRPERENRRPFLLQFLISFSIIKRMVPQLEGEGAVLADPVILGDGGLIEEQHPVGDGISL